jgi:hypothetical protein
VIPDILAYKSPEQPIRLWVPGCGTGEEALSLAILYDEAMERSGKRHPMQIFATDIDAEAINKAVEWGMLEFSPFKRGKSLMFKENIDRLRFLNEEEIEPLLSACLPHLRHTFASHLVMRGVGLRAVQELLGHCDLKLTMRYAHLAPGHLRDSVNALNDLGGGKQGEGKLLGIGI